MGLPQRNDIRFDSRHRKQQILENNSIVLWYYPELKIIHHQMKQAPESDHFRELLSSGAELVERHGAKKWLSDDRKNTVLRESDEEWADRVWLPRVLAGGFKYWAIVLPAAAIGKLNMRRLAEMHGRRGIISRVEAAPESAFEWLTAQ